jgi:hypothetical protein
MNRFINVKPLSGELKRTEIRRGTGYRLTDKELILLREDISYHILLEDILGVISREEESVSGITETYGDTNVTHKFGGTTYKIVAMKMRVYNRSGVYESGSSTVYTQLSEAMTEQLLNMLTAN